MSNLLYIALIVFLMFLAGCGYKSDTESNISGNASVNVESAVKGEEDIIDEDIEDVIDKVIESSSEAVIDEGKNDTGDEITKEPAISEQNINEVTNMEYRILEPSEYNYKSETKGFELQYTKETPLSTICIISAGMKPTGGYSIKIDKVDIQDGKVFVTVTEKAPAENQSVTTALTYPSCAFEIDGALKYSDFVITDTDGNSFNFINLVAGETM